MLNGEGRCRAAVLHGVGVRLDGCAHAAVLLSISPTQGVKAQEAPSWPEEDSLDAGHGSRHAGATQTWYGLREKDPTLDDRATG